MCLVLLRHETWSFNDYPWDYHLGCVTRRDCWHDLATSLKLERRERLSSFSCYVLCLGYYCAGEAPERAFLEPPVRRTAEQIG